MVWAKRRFGPVPQGNQQQELSPMSAAAQGATLGEHNPLIDLVEPGGIEPPTS